MPVVSFEHKDSTLIVSQSNNRGLVWPQSFEVAVISGDKEQKVNVELYGTSVSVPLSFSPKYVVPNVDGTGYAYFSIDDASLNYLIDNWSRQSSPLTRQTMLMTIYENYLHGKADASKLVDSFVSGIANESDRLLSASLIGYLEYIATHSVDTVSLAVQDKVNTLSKTYADKSVSLQMRRMLARIMTDPELINEIYAEWEKGSSDTWNANDLTDLSYELAIRMPERSKDILTKQRSRIENPDKLREFDFVSKSCVADSNVRDRLFEELLTSEGRRNEVFARKALYYLNHFTRDEESVKYIRPALEALETVRAEGDIFFPGTWCNSLLRGHKSPSARKEVTTFLESDTAYPKLLRNKILYAAYSLMEAGKYQE
jgi:aminopeptidase N